MRRRLRILALAISTVVTIAFAVPLLYYVRNQQRDLAIARASSEAREVSSYAALTDASRLQAVMAQLGYAESPNRIEVWYPDGRTIGVSGVTPRGATPSDGVRSLLQQRTDVRPRTQSVPGGVEVLWPVTTVQSGSSVVRVFVPDAQLARGVAPRVLWLAAIALALVLASVVAADRVAAMPLKRDGGGAGLPRGSFGGPTAAGAAD